MNETNKYDKRLLTEMRPTLTSLLEFGIVPPGRHRESHPGLPNCFLGAIPSNSSSTYLAAKIPVLRPSDCLPNGRNAA